MADESFDSIHWSMAMNGSSELTDDSETWSSSEEEDSSSYDEDDSSSYDEDDPR